jgi:hypothetical protein
MRKLRHPGERAAEKTAQTYHSACEQEHQTHASAAAALGKKVNLQLAAA